MVRNAALTPLLGCSDDPAVTASEVTVDSFNVGLAGAFIPFESQRRTAIGAAIAQMPSDIVCLQEVWREEDKDAIVTAATGSVDRKVPIDVVRLLATAVVEAAVRSVAR